MWTDPMDELIASPADRPPEQGQYGGGHEAHTEMRTGKTASSAASWPPDRMARSTRTTRRSSASGRRVIAR